VDRLARMAKRNRKIRLMPSSAGTTATDWDAKSTPLFMEIKTKAIIIVEGSVPRIPPTFVPYFSAMMVIMITISADRTNGMTD